MSKYDINKAFRRDCLITVPLSKSIVKAAQRYLKKQDKCLKKIEKVKAETIGIPVYDGMIEAQIIVPENVKEKNPCIFDIHGGGFVYDASSAHYRNAARYAIETGSIVVFPRYRLAPAYTYPTAINDCRAAFEWVFEHADEFLIDKERIGICGDSAGGYLAARTTNWAVSKGYQVSCQLLIYPVTDSKMTTDSMKKYTDTPVWNARLNKIIWDWYYNGRKNVEFTLLEDILPENIPVTYLETAEFDCLHDEGLLYAERLKNAGVQVLINETRATMHGFDMTDCEITREALKKRIAFMKKQI